MSTSASAIQQRGCSAVKHPRGRVTGPSGVLVGPAVAATAAVVAAVPKPALSAAPLAAVVALGFFLLTLTAGFRVDDVGESSRWIASRSISSSALTCGTSCLPGQERLKVEGQESTSAAQHERLHLAHVLRRGRWGADHGLLGQAQTRRPRYVKVHSLPDSAGRPEGSLRSPRPSWTARSQPRRPSRPGWPHQGRSDPW